MKSKEIFRQSPTFLLKIIIIFAGVLVLIACLFLSRMFFAEAPTNLGYYFPILFLLDVTAIPFFIAIWQALKLLGYIDNGKAFSSISIKAIKHIKYCAFIVCGFYMVGMPYIFYAAGQDDAPGVAAIGLMVLFASFVFGIFCHVLQRLLQNAVDIKSENDLTV